MILRVAAILLLTLLLAPLQILLAATPARAWLPRRFMAAMVRLIGVRVVRHGAMAGGGTLYVANHLSWMEILVLGSVIEVAFVAKSEVRNWGIVGWLAGIAGTIFVERERRRQSRTQVGAVTARLAEGRPVILFPEGGSSDGRVILPFKPTLFAAAEGVDAPVQPVTVAFTRIGPLPVTRHSLARIAWLGDTPLGQHALAFLRLPPVRCELLFHPPVRMRDFADRKALATYCRTVIDDGYRRLMRGGA